MSKKILHILRSNKFSGAENVVCQIIKLFNENEEYEEMIYVSPEGPIEDALKERNIKYVPIKKLSVGEIKRVIKEYNPDIVHAHDKSAIVISSLAVSRKIKLIAHVHCTFDMLSSKNLKSLIFYNALKKCKKVVFVSTESYNSFIFKDKISDKCISLRNIINPEEIRLKIKKDDNEYDNDIIFLGRLTYQKNPERFINIIENVKKEINNVKVAIVGDGDLREKIESLIKEKNLSENIKMYGFVSNPYKLLSQSKALIMTSRSEGTPMVALEAMSVGLPIISTPVDGLKEIVINDENGFLSDSNEELANAIIKLLQNKNYMSEMIKNAKEKFEEINDLENYKKCLEKVYEK